MVRGHSINKDSEAYENLKELPIKRDLGLYIDFTRIAFL